MTHRRPRFAGRARARLLLVAAGSALVALPACATKGDLRNLRQDMAAAQQTQDDAFANLERRLAVLMDSVELTLELQRNAQGQTASQVRALGQDIQQLRNLVDDTQTRLERLLGEFTRLDQLMDRLEAMARSGGIVPGGGTPPPPPGGSQEAREFYELGLDYLNDGSFATARTAFEQVVADFGNDPYAALAQLKIGETWVGQQRPDSAIRAFEIVAERWPESTAAPDALYRAGFVAAEANDRQRARAFWERLIRTYDGTDAARLAEDGLRRIGGG